MTKRIALVVFAVLLAGGVARSEMPDGSPQAIEYLLGYVARSDSTFIRNGKSYSAKEAAAHLRSKYDYFKRQIATPEDFIRLAGTKSELSGKAYLVQTHGGQVYSSADWLSRILADYRASQPLTSVK